MEEVEYLRRVFCSKRNIER